MQQGEGWISFHRDNEVVVLILRVQEKLLARGQTSRFFVAQTCALMGNRQEALHYLKVAHDTESAGNSEAANIRSRPWGRAKNLYAWSYSA